MLKRQWPVNLRLNGDDAGIFSFCLNAEAQRTRRGAEDGFLIHFHRLVPFAVRFSLRFSASSAPLR